MTRIIYPMRFMIIEREARQWSFYVSKVFYNPRAIEVPLEPDEVLIKFGLSMSKVVIELFRINGGKLGYYLANLRDKKYYYCGEGEDSVKDKLLELGIGRVDPMEVKE